MHGTLKPEKHRKHLICKIKGSTFYEKTTSHSPTSTSNSSLLDQNMFPNQPQNYFEFPLLILWCFGTHFGSDWSRILPRVWPRTNPFGPQRASQWPQKAPRGPKGLPWRAPRGPKGSPRRPTMPFWLNFGWCFPGGSANFALNHGLPSAISNPHTTYYNPHTTIHNPHTTNYNPLS